MSLPSTLYIILFIGIMGTSCTQLCSATALSTTTGTEELTQERDRIKTIATDYLQHSTTFFDTSITTALHSLSSFETSLKNTIKLMSARELPSETTPLPEKITFLTTVAQQLYDSATFYHKQVNDMLITWYAPLTSTDLIDDATLRTKLRDSINSLALLPDDVTQKTFLKITPHITVETTIPKPTTEPMQAPLPTSRGMKGLYEFITSEPPVKEYAIKQEKTNLLQDIEKYRQKIEHTREAILNAADVLTDRFKNITRLSTQTMQNMSSAYAALQKPTFQTESHTRQFETLEKAIDITHDALTTERTKITYLLTFYSDFVSSAAPDNLALTALQEQIATTRSLLQNLDAKYAALIQEIAALKK